MSIDDHILEYLRGHSELINNLFAKSGISFGSGDNGELSARDADNVTKIFMGNFADVAAYAEANPYQPANTGLAFAFTAPELGNSEPLRILALAAYLSKTDGSDPELAYSFMLNPETIKNVLDNHLTPQKFYDYFKDLKNPDGTSVYNDAEMRDVAGFVAGIYTTADATFVRNQTTTIAETGAQEINEIYAVKEDAELMSLATYLSTMNETNPFYEHRQQFMDAIDTIRSFDRNDSSDELLSAYQAIAALNDIRDYANDPELNKILNDLLAKNNMYAFVKDVPINEAVLQQQRDNLAKIGSQYTTSQGDENLIGAVNGADVIIDAAALGVDVGDLTQNIPSNQGQSNGARKHSR